MILTSSTLFGSTKYLHKGCNRNTCICHPDYIKHEADRFSVTWFLWKVFPCHYHKTSFFFLTCIQCNTKTKQQQKTCKCHTWTHLGQSFRGLCNEVKEWNENMCFMFYVICSKYLKTIADGWMNRNKRSLSSVLWFSNVKQQFFVDLLRKKVLQNKG